jgi:hypothetical protein
MLFAVRSHPSLSRLQRDEDDASSSSSLLLGVEKRASRLSAWASRTDRRLKLLCFAALAAVYLVFAFDLLPHSDDTHSSKIIHLESGVTSNAESTAVETTVEGSTPVMADAPADTEITSAVDTGVIKDVQATIDEQEAAERAAVTKEAFIRGKQASSSLDTPERTDQLTPRHNHRHPLDRYPRHLRWPVAA